MEYVEKDMKELGTKEEQLTKLKQMASIAEKINKSKCKYCYSGGSEGFSVKLNQHLPCRCITKAAKKLVMNGMKEKIYESAKN